MQNDESICSVEFGELTKRVSSYSLELTVEKDSEEAAMTSQEADKCTSSCSCTSTTTHSSTSSSEFTNNRGTGVNDNTVCYFMSFISE